ncbi:MAG TPA: ATP-binding protein [bacterium]|nr:ATP-binding protein [bacterium]
MAETSTDLTLDPEILENYKVYDRRVRIDTIKLFCWLIFTLMPAGFTLDYFVYPDHLWAFLKMRLVCSAIVAVLWVMVQTSFGLKYYRALGFILPLLPCFFISLMIWETNGVSSTYYAGLNLVILAIGMVCPWTYQENLWEGMVIMAMYVLACLLHPEPMPSFGVLFNNLYFIILTQIIVGASSWSQGKLRLREFALRFEVDRSSRMLKETNEKLVEMDRMKSQFFANISHELRTPLTLMLAPLEELQRQVPPDPQVTETLRLMRTNGMRLLKLINDLLDLVKLESGRVEVKREPVSIPEMIRGLAQSVQPAARGRKVRLSASVPDGLGVALLDRDKMEKIVLNLLFNSVKFTSAGGEVAVEATEEEGELVIRVRDTGVGISEKDLPFIFDRFWQADATAQRKYQGTGIGLALVRELTEAQGGKVSVESQVGKGTVMTVRVPLERTTEAPAEPSEGEGAGVPGSGSDQWLAKLYRRAELFPAMTEAAEKPQGWEGGSSKRPRLVLADDEPDMLRFVKSQLGRDYEILEAVNGTEAVEKTRQYLPEVVVLDMMMPEKDGIEACREIKAEPATRTIPVLLLTAWAEEKTKLAALQAGASDFLTKPFSTTELHVRVKNLIASHRTQSELSRQNLRLESALEQLKETESSLVQSEKMSSLGRMSAGMIHEINNPLNYALSALNVLKGLRAKWPEGERAKLDDLMADMQEGMTRVQRIVSDLRDFTHPHGRALGPVDLEEALATALRFLGHETEKNARIVLTVPKNQQVFAEKNNLTHVFVNLFQNALDAMKAKDHGDEKPTLAITVEEKNGRVLIRVRDNGTGIAPRHLDKIFDPFFTTKDVGQGMGLGLSICYRIVKDMGGEISAASEEGKFTEFTLDLPAQAPSTKGAEEASRDLAGRQPS